MLIIHKLLLTVMYLLWYSRRKKIDRLIINTSSSYVIILVKTKQIILVYRPKIKAKLMCKTIEASNIYYAERSIIIISHLLEEVA